MADHPKTETDTDGKSFDEPEPTTTPSQPRSAIRSIVTSSWIWATLTAATIFLIGAYASQIPWKFPNDPRDVRSYEQLKEILDDVRRERAKSSPDFSAVRQRAMKVGPEIAKEMTKQASTKFPAKQLLLWAARDELPRMMLQDLKSETETERPFEDRLQMAAKQLGIK